MIENSGKVRISEACILSFGAPVAGQTALDMYMHGPSVGSNWEYVLQSNVDLGHWIRSYRPPKPNYAVCLQHTADFTYPSGIPLKEIRPGILVKVGVFFSTTVGEGGELPAIHFETRSVEWTVL